ncbi:hypothetical protein RI367_000407 [Sorochytrium milnesiophthora]
MASPEFQTQVDAVNRATTASTATAHAAATSRAHVRPFGAGLNFLGVAAAATADAGSSAASCSSSSSSSSSHSEWNPASFTKNRAQRAIESAPPLELPSPAYGFPSGSPRSKSSGHNLLDDSKSTSERLVHMNKKLELEDTSVRFYDEDKATRLVAKLRRKAKFKLLPHQVRGVLWMIERERDPDLRGGLLADDMGLGKTIQAIALMLVRPAPEQLPFKNSTHMTLIVVPLAVLQQWKDEIEQRLKEPTLRVYIYHEKKERRDPAELGDLFDVVVTTYGMVSSEWDHVGPFRRVHWHRIILDEAHAIKGGTTNVTKACWKLGATNYWCLTGTPIHNNLDEFRSMYKFICGDAPQLIEYWDSRIRPFYKGYKHVPPDVFQFVNPIRDRILLRRTKHSTCMGRPLITLPERHYDVLSIELSDKERIFYDKFERKMNDAANNMMAGENNYLRVFALLTRLRQAVDHPRLIESDFVNEPIIKTSASADDDDEVVADLTSLIDSLAINCEDECRLCQNPVGASGNAQGYCRDCVDLCHGVNAFGTISSKIASMLRVLKDNRTEDPGSKTVVFSLFTKFLDMLEVPLRKEGIQFCRYDGSMNDKKRQMNLNKFRDDEEVTVILMSLKAGCVGLNLTHANHVIILDSWWTAVLENQAVDRIGQEKPVTVTKIVVKDSVDDRIVALQKSKQDLADRVLIDGDVLARANAIAEVEQPKSPQRVKGKGKNRAKSKSAERPTLEALMSLLGRRVPPPSK